MAIEDTETTDTAAEPSHDDAAILQGLRDLGLDPGTDEPEKPAAEPEPKPKPVEPKPEEVEVDEATKKQLEAQQAWDRKRKELAAKDRAEIDAVKAQLETEWKPKIELAEQFEAMKGRGVVGAMKALELLGLAPEDYAALAPAAWALSPKGSTDPAAKARAAATLAAAGTNKEIEAARKEAAEARKAVADINAKLAAREESARHEAEVAKYLAGVEAAVATVDAPLVKRMAEKSPARVRELYGRVAIDLLDRDGAVPDHKAVVAEAERRERADLADRGIDIAQLLGAAKPAVNGKKPGPTLGNAGAGAVKATDAVTDADLTAGLHNLWKSGSVS